MISEHISDDIPPQMKILNMVIPILMHFCSFVENLSVASRVMPHVIKRNMTYLMMPNVSCSILQDILSQIFEIIQSEVALQKQVH